MQPDAARTLLGVTVSANEEQIKRAWRELALRWHPDKNGSGAPAACSTLRAHCATTRTGVVVSHCTGGGSHGCCRGWVAVCSRRTCRRLCGRVVQAHR